MSGWGLPLPFKGVNNCRSFLYLGNLVDAIVVCINHPQAAGEVFLISDGQDISTSDLIKMIAKAMNKKVFLFSLPAGILKMLSRLVGNAEYLEKITESFFVNSNKIRDLLGWKPPFTLEEGIRKTVKTLRI
jgi:nucleoside-diphosphate-sugar epimerase